jgi:hypothetical protein
MSTSYNCVIAISDKYYQSFQKSRVSTTSGSSAISVRISFETRINNVECSCHV